MNTKDTIQKETETGKAGHEIESPLPWTIEASAFNLYDFVVRDAN